MPTTNLITKSLGSVELSSGNGSPDHSAPKGTLYTDASTGTPWINSSGTASGWEPLLKPGYAEVFLNANGVATTISATNSWVDPNTLTWNSSGFLNGFTRTGTSSLVVSTNKGGKYMIIFNGTIGAIAGATTQTYELGISYNGATPSNGLVQSATLQVLSPADYRTVNVNGYLDLNDGDTIGPRIRCTTNNTNITLRFASLIAIKIY